MGGLLTRSIKSQLLFLGLSGALVVLALFLYTATGFWKLRENAQVYIQEKLKFSLAIGRIEAYDLEQEKIVKNLLAKVARPPVAVPTPEKLLLEKEKFDYFSTLILEEYQKLYEGLQAELSVNTAGPLLSAYSTFSRVLDISISNYEQYTSIVEQVFQGVLRKDYLEAKALYDELESAEQRSARFITELENVRASILSLMRENNSDLSHFLNIILLLSLASILITGLGAFLIWKELMRPLKKLIEITTRVAHGERELPITPKGGKEFQELFHSVETMLHSIEDAEHRTAKKTELLERSNREISAFSHTVAHDLKSPLSAAVGMTELLREECEQSGISPEGKNYLKRLDSILNNMNRLIEDLLSYAQVDSMDITKEEVDVQAVLDQCRLNLQNLIQLHHAEIEIQELPVTVPAKHTLLLQVFQNLIGNAIKYKGSENPKVTISCRKEAKNYLFSVRDNGAGIEAQYIEQIFQIFNRGNSRYRATGFGVGLATVKRIVERLGGEIWLRSQPGKGSEFFFTLPRNLEKPIRHRSHRPSATP